MPTLYEQILKKPKSYRRRLSYAITALLGILIFAIWLVMTTLSMKEAFNSEDGVENLTDSISKELEQPSFEKETENLKGTTNQSKKPSLIK